MNSITTCLIFIVVLFYNFNTTAFAGDTAKRKAFLEQILSVLPSEKPEQGRVSHLDSTWLDWLQRTGELPPDFDKLPSISRLPEPLVLENGAEIKTLDEWQQRKAWIAKELKHWVTGTFPPPPENLESKIFQTEKKHGVTVRQVELSFGPEHKARMHVELLIPDGDGPFPVFLTQSNHRAWAMMTPRLTRNSGTRNMTLPDSCAVPGAPTVWWTICLLSMLSTKRKSG